MAFLQPWVLLALAAAAIPALLHLIGRRLPPTVSFPAVRYLTATEREHSRRLKLRHLLLVLLRTAIIAAVVLAAARPVTRVGAGGAHPPTALAIVLDNSASSGAVVGGRRVLDHLVAHTRLVLGRVSADDRLWLVLADGIPRRLRAADAHALLDSLGPWPVRFDLGRGARVAGRVVTEAPERVREVVLVSDLQAAAVSAGEPVGARVLVWQPPQAPANRAVDSAFAVPPVWSPSGEVVAVLAGARREAVAVRVVVEGVSVAQAIAAPGERVVLPVGTLRPGWAAAQVEVDADELRADDRWWLALRVTTPAAVRVEPGAGHFVAEAVSVLRAGGRIADGPRVALGDRPLRGTTIVVPPADPAQVGSVNRALEARGVPWRFDDLVRGEWTLDGDVGAVRDAAIYRRYRVRGAGAVIARAGGDPWLVRHGDLVLLGSRLELDWTALPVHAAFVPFLDALVNRIAAEQSWVVPGTPGAVLPVPESVARLLLSDGGEASPRDSRVTAPYAPGVYFLTEATGDTVGALEVNVDRRESALEPASAEELRSALGHPIEVLGTAAMERELFGGARRAELSGALLTAALIMAVAELLVASVGAFRRRG